MKVRGATHLIPCILNLLLAISTYGASVANSNHTLATGGHHGNASDANDTSHHGNKSDHGGEHVGIHVAAWNFAYVELPFLVCLFILLVAFCKIGYHHANFLSSYVPESCILIILGTLVGLIFHYTGLSHFNEYFTPRNFFLFLLPPIILESAYSLNDRTFADNLGVVILFAVVGTILNFVVIGPTLYGLSICGAMGPIDLSLVHCFLFSSLIVAVDPVAVLAIFQEVGVNNVLYFMVFGESLLNDAVTVVLYNMMNTFAKMDEIPAGEIALGFLSFLTISLGGLVIGIILGILSSITLKYCSHVRVVEPLMMFLFAYLSYLCAELFHFSGIISLIGCGLVQTQYAFHNVSHKSFTTVKYFTKMISAVSEAVIFLFLGQSLVTPHHEWHTGFAIWAVLLCLLVRFIVVFTLSLLANRFKKIRKVDWHEQFIMAYGGLRGAVSFSLAVMLSSKDVAHRDLFITTTLVVVLFTVFVQGTTIKPLVKLLHIALKKEQYDSLVEEIHVHVQDHMLAGLEEVIGHRGDNYFREKCEYFEDKYFRRWFLKESCRNRYESIMLMFDKIALEQHYAGLPGSKVATEYAEKKLRRQSTFIGGGSTTSVPESLTLHGFDDTFPSILAHPEMMDNQRTRKLVGHWQKVVAAKKAEKVSVDLLGLPDADKSTRSERRNHLLLPKLHVDEDKESKREIKKMLSFRPSKALHQTYDRNLVNDDDQDLMQQLHHKNLLTQRMVRSRTLSPASSELSLASTPAHVHVPLTPLDPIPESDSDDELVADESTKLEADPNSNTSLPDRTKKSRRNRPPLIKANTIDMGMEGNVGFKGDGAEWDVAANNEETKM